MALTSVGFLLSFSLDISDIVERSGIAQVIGNICFRFELKQPALCSWLGASTMLVLVVSSSLSRYHLERRGWVWIGDPSDRSSVIRLLNDLGESRVCSEPLALSSSPCDVLTAVSQDRPHYDSAWKKNYS